MSFSLFVINWGGFIPLQIFSHFHRFIIPFCYCRWVHLQNIYLQLCSDEASFDWLHESSVIKFSNDCQFFLNSFSSDLGALSIISRFTASSTVGITLLISLIIILLLSSQVSPFLGRGMFLKIRVFLRLLLFPPSISSFITVTSSLRADIWYFN